MNGARFYSLFCIVFLSCACSFFDSPNIYVEPNRWSGKRVIFADLDDNYKRTNNFNRIWSKIHKNRYRPYFRFLGQRYIIVGTLERFKKDFLVIKDMNGNQYKMELKEKGNELESLPSYFLSDDLEKKAKNMIGKKLWLNNTKDPNNFYTFSDYEFKRFEPVMVLDFFPFQNKDYDHPVWLKIQSLSGDEGFVRYNGDEGRIGIQDHYYITEPIPSSLDKRLIDKILDKEIEIGMEDRQVRISIGNPDEINTTSSRHGVGEQWIFIDQKGNKTYYQFEYGKLTYISN